MINLYGVYHYDATGATAEWADLFSSSGSEKGVVCTKFSKSVMGGGLSSEAEEEYLLSAALEANGTTWSSLAAIYHHQGRLMEEIAA